MVAVGSGITPMLSHIQSILEAEPDSFVTLIYGNQSTPKMMFRDKLCFIKNAHMARFQWINLFTREENEAELFNGRINDEKLTELNKARVINLKTFDDVFLCGPEAMITNLVEFFKGQEYTDDQIHYELFFAGSAEEKAQQT